MIPRIRQIQIRNFKSIGQAFVDLALAQASRQEIREHLYKPGELLRSNELNQDVQAATAAADHLDLFGESPPTSRFPARDLLVRG